MTVEILILLLLLAAMVVLFLTEALRVEVTAFTALLILISCGYVSIEDAFSGFSSPAVITMFSIFFIATGLSQTGVADRVGRTVARLAGDRERLLIALIMLVAALLSAFMFNVAAVAVMMPAVASIARHIGVSASRLFMPLAFGAILGGTTTIVGTPPNILTAEEILGAGLEPLGLFEMAPIGLVLVGVGVVYSVTFGRRLLPDRLPVQPAESRRSIVQVYRLEDRLTSLRIPELSGLDGKTIGESRLGAALDVVLLRIDRGGRPILAPAPEEVLRSGDRLLVDGRRKDVASMLEIHGLEPRESVPGRLQDVSRHFDAAVLGLPRGSDLIGRSLRESRFGERFGLQVVGIRRKEEVLREQLARRVLRETDEILVVGTRERVDESRALVAFDVLQATSLDEALGQRRFFLHVPDSSSLVGTSLRASRLGELAGLTVIGRLGADASRFGVHGDDIIEPGDELLVAGDPAHLMGVLSACDIELEGEVGDSPVHSDSVRLGEIVVSPRSQLEGSSLRDLRFRERFGLQALAISREDRRLRTDLANIPLRVGDALLVQGPLQTISELGESPDFIVLTDTISEQPLSVRKELVAVGSLVLMITFIVLGTFPIHLSAFLAAVCAVTFGALSMDDAYRAIEWKALFLVAAILPVGIAMESSGAATYLAGGVTSVASAWGPYVFLACLIVLASLLSQGLDGAPTVVILSPVAIEAAHHLAISPKPLLVAIGLAASAGFVTPFSQKACLLVMGAGGYRTSDFVRVGGPLTLFAWLAIFLLVPVFFPL